jgi:hypothetical protein
VGDRVRIVRLPSIWDRPDYRVDPSTQRLYRRLIARKRSMRVFWIDEFDQPWIQGRHRDKSTWWTLAISDDSWVRVKRRAKTRLV